MFIFWQGEQSGSSATDQHPVAIQLAENHLAQPAASVFFLHLFFLPHNPSSCPHKVNLCPPGLGQIPVMFAGVTGPGPVFPNKSGDANTDPLLNQNKPYVSDYTWEYTSGLVRIGVYQSLIQCPTY